MRSLNLATIGLSVAAALFSLACAHIPQDDLFKAEAFTKPRLFTDGIEGPACDRDGNVYVVNFREQGTIGRVLPDGTAERSEEHTSELQSQSNLVCRLLL